MCVMGHNFATILGSAVAPTVLHNRLRSNLDSNLPVGKHHMNLQLSHKEGGRERGRKEEWKGEREEREGEGREGKGREGKGSEGEAHLTTMILCLLRKCSAISPTFPPVTTMLHPALATAFTCCRRETWNI